jgi:hypothetical protein
MTKIEFYNDKFEYFILIIQFIFTLSYLIYISILFFYYYNSEEEMPRGNFQWLSGYSGSSIFLILLSGIIHLTYTYKRKTVINDYEKLENDYDRIINILQHFIVLPIVIYGFNVSVIYQTGGYVSKDIMISLPALSTVAAAVTTCSLIYYFYRTAKRSAKTNLVRLST